MNNKKVKAIVKDERPPHFWAMNCIYDHYCPKIGYAAFALYLALCKYANSKTNEAFPTVSTLNKWLKMSNELIRKSRGILMQYKLIKYEKIKPKGRIIYTILNQPCVICNRRNENHEFVDSITKNRGTITNNKYITNNQYKQEYITLFTFWNAQEYLMKHKIFTERMKSKINARIREGFSLDDIMQSIKNYDKIYGEAKESLQRYGENGKFWTSPRKWALDEFLSQSNGFQRFLDFESAEEVYTNNNYQPSSW